MWFQRLTLAEKACSVEPVAVDTQLSEQIGLQNFRKPIFRFAAYFLLLSHSYNLFFYVVELSPISHILAQWKALQTVLAAYFGDGMHSGCRLSLNRFGGPVA